MPFNSYHTFNLNKKTFEENVGGKVKQNPPLKKIQENYSVFCGKIILMIEDYFVLEKCVNA